MDKRAWWTKAAWLGALWLAGCGGGGEGTGGAPSTNVKSPYPRYSLATQVQYVAVQPDGSTSTASGRVVGEKEIGGQTFSRYAIGDTADASIGGVEVWGTLLEDGSVEVAGVEYQVTTGSTLPVPGYVSATLDTPYVLEIEPPLGEPQSFDVAGTSVLGSRDATPITGNVSGSYTLEETGVSVETPTGTVSGCNHYSLQTQLPMLLGEMPIRGDVYYHPQLGIVKAELAEPLAGLGLGYAGSSDVSELAGGFVSVQKLSVLGGNGEGSFQLSTYDAFGELDADKQTHAKMLLEVRWLDDDKAMTSDQPYVTTDFGTVLGYFGSSFVQSQVSFFFPEESGKGYTHWIAFVDEAAKNEAVNGIAYHINASYEPDFSPVRVTGRIVYKRLTTP